MKNNKANELIEDALTSLTESLENGQSDKLSLRRDLLLGHSNHIQKLKLSHTPREPGSQA